MMARRAASPVRVTLTLTVSSAAAAAAAVRRWKICES
jgi:hypothetical protein